MPTNIAWTDETWNWGHGCSRVSAGCDNCYAERLSHDRHGWTDHPWTGEHAAENVSVKWDRLEEGGDGHPSTYDEPKRVFVNSMFDVFHSEIPEEAVRESFRVMRNYPEHVFQILTKRPRRAADMAIDWPPNVWMGTSVEDERVTARLDYLRECDAELHFVSFEPLIGSVGDVDLSGYDWAIVGGESGPDYREMDHRWAFDILRQCREQDVAYFFKQSAASRPEQDQELTIHCESGQVVQKEIREVPEPHEAVQEAREALVA
jgi:protein gp37